MRGDKPVSCAVAFVFHQVMKFTSKEIIRTEKQNLLTNPYPMCLFESILYQCSGRFNSLTTNGAHMRHHFQQAL
jgi:hypothetical protein